MRSALARRIAPASLAVLALAWLVVPIASRAAEDATVLEACINPGNGGMRLVAPDVACHARETRVQWNVTGPAGPTGPQGPAGEDGEDGEDGADGVALSGPPYVWICTPAHYPNAAGSPRADLYVFNGGPVTANIALNILDRDGSNLTGVVIPGAVGPNPADPPPTYPGQAGSSTVTLQPAHTKNYSWYTPATGGPGFDGVTNVAFSVRVTSDQPIAVGSNFGFSGFIPLPCSQVRP